MQGVSTVLDETRSRLLATLTRVAERKTVATYVAGRRVCAGQQSWARIAEAHERYAATNATMLSARPATGACSLAQLDAALVTDFGRGSGKPQGRGAKGRLRDLLVIVGVLDGMGEGLRFGELIAATGLDDSRLWFVLRWAERQGVLVSCGEYGWFIAGSNLAEVYAERHAMAQNGMR